MGGKEQVLDKEKVLAWYSREDVQDAICSEALGKEIGVKYVWGYGKRPDIIANPADVYELAKEGATSFHFSEEIWYNPLQISAKLGIKELGELRKGWDLIIDIDTPHFEYSRVAAHYIIQALKHYGISSISCKFSGNHGFHIGVPFEAFPPVLYDLPMRSLFPEAPRKVAGFLKHKVEKLILRDIFEKETREQIAKNVGKDVSEIKKDSMDAIVDVDTVLISSRHLCRMPYVFNEKSGLVSITIHPDDVLTFNRDDATPEKITEIIPFMDRATAMPGEAKRLFVEAYDSGYEDVAYNTIKSAIEKEVTYEQIKDAAPEDSFPPCIKHILGGLDDGKKRALFALTHFLKTVGWSHEAIEARLLAWNDVHKERLKETYIRGQLRYFKTQNARLPPNCDNEAYYKGIGVCKPDHLCKTLNNPVSYAKRRLFHLQNVKPEKKKVEKPEIKEEKPPTAEKGEGQHL